MSWAGLEAQAWGLTWLVERDFGMKAGHLQHLQFLEVCGGSVAPDCGAHTRSPARHLPVIEVTNIA